MMISLPSMKSALASKSAARMPVLLLAVAALSGCASIIEGSSQEIMVNTNPAGASCVFERGGMPIGTIDPTPGAILIQKTKYDIIIKCNKEGYDEATYFNKSGAAGAAVGNIVFGLLGGGIGWAIDSASGADNKYDSPVNLSLSTPEEARAAKKDGKKKASAAPAAAQTAAPKPASDFPSQSGN